MSGAARHVRYVLVAATLLLQPALTSAQGTLEDYRRAATIQQRYNGLTVRRNGTQRSREVQDQGVLFAP